MNTAPCTCCYSIYLQLNVDQELSLTPVVLAMAFTRAHSAVLYHVIILALMNHISLNICAINILKLKCSHVPVI